MQRATDCRIRSPTAGRNRTQLDASKGSRAMSEPMSRERLAEARPSDQEVATSSVDALIRMMSKERVVTDQDPILVGVV